jgi:DNA-binding transcriptional regulator YdaS (Cro superfamily)
VYVRTLQRAAELVGGEEALARRLKVTPSHLALWLHGVVLPPCDFFLKAADIVSEHEIEQLTSRSADMALAAPPSKDKAQVPD